MSAEHVVREETFLSPAESETAALKANAAVSNIISLAEQGLLHSAKPEEKFEHETFGYRDYSPLNEW